MSALLITLWIAGAIALATAIHANRKTSLLLTVFWACFAWVAIGWWILNPGSATTQIALAMTSAAGVSVLGARWPGALAWQFVVIGLLGVMYLPLIEAHLIGTPLVLIGLRFIFVIGLMGTAVVNYLPTRLGISAMSVGIWAAMAFWNQGPELAPVAVACAPLIGWLSLAFRRPPSSNTTRLWLGFRDRFGAIWSLRVMEQFNRSAANSGSATTMKWNGLNGPDGPDTYERLCAVLKRFGMPNN